MEENLPTPLTVEEAQAFTYVEGEDKSMPLVRKSRGTGPLPGHGTRNRYRKVKSNGRQVLVHHIVWVLHNGPIPEGMQIDHIDMDKHNNLISNLRLVTASENCRNRRHLGGTSKYRGVSKRADGIYHARLEIAGIKHYIASSPFEEVVAAEYDSAVDFVFGDGHGYPTNRSEGLLPEHVRIGLSDEAMERLSSRMGALGTIGTPRDL